MIMTENIQIMVIFYILHFSDQWTTNHVSIKAWQQFMIMTEYDQTSMS